MLAVSIREEQPNDVATIREINRQAFETNIEADIVGQLRVNCAERISLVAQLEDKLIGHILFTPAIVQTDDQQVKGMGLAPMAVLPRYQRRGIGSALVRRGMERIQQAGYPFVVVLGHPNYYPRFGFERASAYKLACEYSGVPEEAFLIKVFDANALKAVTGQVKYRHEFTSAV